MLSFPHIRLLCLCLVVVPQQVKHGMDAKEGPLPLEGMPVLLCLLPGLLQRNDNVAQGFGFCVYCQLLN